MLHAQLLTIGISRSYRPFDGLRTLAAAAIRLTGPAEPKVDYGILIS